MKRELWVPAEPESATVARHFVREVALELGLDDCVDDLMLAATEAVTNAVLHGAPCERRGIQIVVELDDDELEVEVCDCGTFQPTIGEPDPLGPSGRGLPIIAAVADRVELLPAPGLTRVRFCKVASSAAA